MSIQEELIKSAGRVLRISQIVFGLVVGTFVLLVISTINPDFEKSKGLVPVVIVDEDPNKIENGIHLRTGLIGAEGLMTVVNNCTGCHSSKLLIQNRMSAERWNATIDWMQKTQNLGDLGENRAIIVNYLTTNYPAKVKGRRENLSNIEWYVLED